MAVYNLNFASAVSDWCHKVEGAVEAVFKESAQRLAHESDAMLVQMVYAAPPAKSGYRRTGFLRASLMASTSQMPAINPAAQPAENGSYTFDAGEISAVIAGAEIGRPLFLGYVAGYSAHVHYGTSKMAGRPWVSMTAQRWPQIVAQVEAELKTRLGL